MGLLNLFLQNQSILDVAQIPTQGNGPVGVPTGEFNTGTTPFIQTWDSSNTYVNSFEGGINTGIQPPTLSETGLDIDNPNFIQSTTIPDTLTLYPATALGGLGQSAVQFLQIWTSVINYNDVVVNAPTSPLEQSLNQTGLDNTDPNAVPTTDTPSTTTVYPSLATGEYNSAPNQYTQPYTSNNTYLNSFNPNTQVSSLSDTGLDIENIGLVSTTVSPSTNTPYPSLASGEFGGQSNNFNQVFTPNNTYLNSFNPQTQPDTIIQGQTGLDNTNPLSAPTTTTPIDPTQYPNQSTGEFGGASAQYNSQYSPNNTYENNYVDNPANFDTLQTTTLDETGLDNTNSQFAFTTLVPIDNTSYPAPPQTNLGEFNGALPALTFTPQYNPGFGYLNNYSTVISNAGNSQINTLGQTGLDIENSNAITFIPNAVSAPTSYPALALGEFGGVSTQYTQIWNPSNQYITNFNPNTQPNTLDETGLDNSNPNLVLTTTTPNTVTQYPQFTQGEFNGAPTQYNQIWSSTNQYIVNYNPNIQPNTLNQTGLDSDNPNFVSTTTTPSTITQYPSVSTGEFGGIPTQYTQIWNSNNTYNTNFNPNSQPNTLSQTGLDVENQNAAPTTTLPTDPTQYPQFVQGEFNGAPILYIQDWNPNNGYFTIFNPTTGNTKQIVTLGQTGLDNTDSNSLPGASTPTPVPISPSQIPPQTYMGEFQDVAQPFIQQYTPSIGGGYLDTYNTIIANAMTNAQVKTIIDPNKYGTGLDNTNSQASQTTFIPVPVGIPATPVTLPAQTFMGEFQGGAQQFNPQYNPNPGQSYLDNYNTIINDNTNPQVSTLDETGLDIENAGAAPTTYVVPQVDNITVYPVEVTGELGSAPTQYTQEWEPTNKYYNFMKENYQVQ